MRIVAIVVSLGITAIAVALAVIAVQQMLKVIQTGKPAVGRTDNPRARWINMLKETLGHTRMLQWHWIGIMHWFVFAGFIFLSSMVAGAYLQIFNAHQALPIIGHWIVYEWPTEALSWLTLIGIIYLIGVRQKNHPRRLERKSRFFGSTFWQAYFVEAVIFGVVLCGFLLRTLEYALDKAAHGEGDKFHYPLTWFFGEAWNGTSVGTLENLVYLIAMVKLVISMTWLIVIARNITMGVAWHRFTAWFNIWFKRESDGSTALGALLPIMIKGKPLDLENLEDLEEEDFAHLGVGKAEDFSWKGILDFTTCTECGRCQSQCPAWATEKPLNPKLLIMNLRDHAYAKAPYTLTAEDARADLSEELKKEGERPLIGDESVYGVIDPDVLWSCTNCGACVQQCPVDIEHVDHIQDMRRYQVLVESNFPPELNQLFKGLERKGNPWNMDPKGRMDWAKGLDFEVKQVGVDIEDLDEVEWLFWVGCAGAYEDRAKKTTQAVAELLNIAGVTFAVLGDGETCTGDPARRAGNEIVFAQLAMQNAEVFKETKVKKVVSTCAHCFNTLKNEYAEFGVELEVVHHTQLLNRLVREGKITPVAPIGGEVGGKTITYHDPCFLGRHNQVYEPPRELLSVIPGATFKEMPRNSEKSFCCGAGGARMWMEETIGTRINVNRTEEAIATGADQIAVGCPFCRIMLSDGLTLKQSEGEARPEVEVLDVAQMLLASVKRTEPAAAKASTSKAAADTDGAAGATAVAVDEKSAGDAEAESEAPAPDEPAGEAAYKTESEPTADDEPSVETKPADNAVHADEAQSAPESSTEAADKAAESEPEPELKADEGTNAPTGDQVSAAASAIAATKSEPNAEDAANPDSVTDSLTQTAEVGATAKASEEGEGTAPTGTAPTETAAQAEQLSFDESTDGEDSDASVAAEAGATDVDSTDETDAKPAVGADSDVDTQQADDEVEGGKFMIAEGGPHEPKPTPPEDDKA
ncbi:MAG: 4Fe-4S dicluster domain-containing protein [Propionibacteriales bacterium]|nr:4Fe-4S dicluster domain-containing protein [Propionibacteriales bacterium]